MEKTEQTLYSHPLSRAYWREAAAQLFNVRILCVTAILIALRVAIKAAQIPVGPELNITFGFFVNALGASVFGPVVAVIAAAITDTLGCIIAPTGTYFFPFIFVEIGGSLIFALWLWRAKLSATRVILSRFFVSAVCNLVLNPLIMIWYYAWLGNGKNYAFMTLPRTVKNLALFPFEAFLLVVFLGAMMPILAKLHLIPKMQTKPILNKKHIALLAVLLVIAIVIVIMFYGLWMPTQPTSASVTQSDVKVTIKAPRAHYAIEDVPAMDYAMTVTIKNGSKLLWEAIEGEPICDISLVCPDGANLPIAIDESTPTSIEAGESVVITEKFSGALMEHGLEKGAYKIVVRTAGRLDGALGSMIAELPIKLK